MTDPGSNQAPDMICLSFAEVISEHRIGECRNTTNGYPKTNNKKYIYILYKDRFTTCFSWITFFFHLSIPSSISSLYLIILKLVSCSVKWPKTLLVFYMFKVISDAILQIPFYVYIFSKWHFKDLFMLKHKDHLSTLIALICDKVYLFSWWETFILLLIMCYYKISNIYNMRVFAKG